jgi:hypothetical protein
MALTYHEDRAPHRKLFRSARGEDVRAFEEALNARLEHVPFFMRRGRFIDPGARVKANGVFDDDDLAAWRIVREAIGLPLDHPPTVQAQRNLRWPWTRTPAARQRAKKRRAGGGWKPKIVTASQLGLRFQYLWGGKGAMDSVAGHYDAGSQVRSEAEAIARARGIHAGHVLLGHGGAAYEVLVGPGILILLNPVDRKSAAVAMQNTGLYSFCVPGTAGDRMDELTKRTLAWAVDNMHTRAIPTGHRWPAPVRSRTRLGHKEFPGQATQCPDTYLYDYREIWR